MAIVTRSGSLAFWTFIVFPLEHGLVQTVHELVQFCLTVITSDGPNTIQYPYDLNKFCWRVHLIVLPCVQILKLLSHSDENNRYYINLVIVCNTLSKTETNFFTCFSPVFQNYYAGCQQAIKSDHKIFFSLFFRAKNSLCKNMRLFRHVAM